MNLMCETRGISNEFKIVWIGLPPKCYDYVREGLMECHSRRRFPIASRNPAECTDGGSRAHLVAYAVWKQDSPASFGMGGVFMRRYWWVKGYDRWQGHGTHNGGWYDHGAPCEAVLVESIRIGLPTEPWSYEKGKTTPWLPVIDWKNSLTASGRCVSFRP